MDTMQLVENEPDVKSTRHHNDRCLFGRKIQMVLILLILVFVILGIYGFISVTNRIKDLEEKVTKEEVTTGQLMKATEVEHNESSDIIERLKNLEKWFAQTHGMKRGPPGKPGPAGIPGSKGEAGLDGAKGQKGDQGTTGEKGDIGGRGPAGSPGSPGIDGVKGQKGDKGSQGTKGIRGEQGDVGSTGERGERGSTGPPGPKGRDGRDGVGQKGEKGQMGHPGIKGDMGIQGNPGEGGVHGLDGKDGEKGEKGNEGPRGQGVKGSKGKPGRMGMPGSKGSTGSPGASGVSYVRWGKNTCPDTGAKLIYEGFVGGAHYSQPGGGANLLCLPKNPIYGIYKEGTQRYGSRIFGAEYESGYGPNIFPRKFHNHEVPCARCHVGSRATQIMVPARNVCPAGWTREYKGYLMAERHSYHRTMYTCVDETGGYINGTSTNVDGALLFFVEGICGSLPCKPYVNGRELTCAVCTR